MCTTAVFFFQFVEELARIGFGVMAVGVGITRRVDTGCTVEGFDFEAGIVGKTIAVIVVVNVVRLLQGVALERVVRLGNICMSVDGRKAEHFDPVAQHGTNLVELMNIVGGKDQFSFHCFHII